MKSMSILLITLFASACSADAQNMVEVSKGLFANTDSIETLENGRKTIDTHEVVSGGNQVKTTFTFECPGRSFAITRKVVYADKKEISNTEHWSWYRIGSGVNPVVTTLYGMTCK